MPDKSDLPSFDKYFPPTVQSMKQRGGSATIEELEEDVAKIMKLTEPTLAIPHKTGTRSQFQYELAWVRTYLKKAGLADNSARGVWSLTDAGEKISDKELFLIPNSGLRPGFWVSSLHCNIGVRSAFLLDWFWALLASFRLASSPRHSILIGRQS
jgi:hypothetical protein